MESPHKILLRWLKWEIYDIEAILDSIVTKHKMDAALKDKIV